VIVRVVCAGAAVAAGLWLAGAQAAEGAFPFIGAWVRADRVCSATSTRERVYTPHDVISSRGRCVVRKVVAGSGASYELFERCERPNERSSMVREIIRMTGPDSMTLTRQTTRLKLSRSVRFTRCAVPAANPAR
jgi:hypothetical protein